MNAKQIDQPYRIVTRPDFDGIVCAVLLKDALGISGPVQWVEPSEVQNERLGVGAGDILANLPFAPGSSLWFDHHVSNRIDAPFEGLFEVAPSAAGLVFRYYRGKFSRDFGELVVETDRIDSAALDCEEVRRPEINPYLLLSMTTDGRDSADRPYWERLVDLLGTGDIAYVMSDAEVARRCSETLKQNEAYEKLLLAHTTQRGHVSITDFRPLHRDPRGNRYLVYSLFSESSVNIKVRHVEGRPQWIGVSVGHSIFNRTCRVNVGLMLSAFGGGGHEGAGGCRFPEDKADDYIDRMTAILLQNQPIENGSSTRGSK